ncbi:IMP dehydrogenase [Robbsia sp. KACC 23696]|uniref:IMP dehydrogenase n=1 Tax=Robbsia sp. KACC 23696 TaxID=3149231 RepID=UPI00325C07A1
MAKVLLEPSRTFGEFLLLPNLTSEQTTPANVSLAAPLVKFKTGDKPDLTLNIPFTSSIMQSVSDDGMAIALARAGGVSFVFSSQSIASQANMVAKVKKYKAGMVESDSNVAPEALASSLVALKQQTGHSTVAVTHDGTARGKLLGIVTSRDYSQEDFDRGSLVADIMTPVEKIISGVDGMPLKDANALIRRNKLNVLPILDKNGYLSSLVFRKDYDEHVNNPRELLDEKKKLLVGAGVNTRDYETRIPALVDAGADVFCIDSSDGYSVWQKHVIDFVRTKYGDKVKIGAGNVVDARGFNYLAEAGADFVKVGIGGGAICITREEKGIGRGQASALMDVVTARDEYQARTGVYIPICSDGGIVYDNHMIIALAMGADFLMMGRYFARFDESPAALVKLGSSYYKEYWGEGSNRARNWERYDAGAEAGAKKGLLFEEGVDAYVPYAGRLTKNVELTLAKIKSTMCSCGSLTLREFTETAVLTVVSAMSLREAGTSDVLKKEDSGIRNV